MGIGGLPTSDGFPSKNGANEAALSAVTQTVYWDTDNPDVYSGARR